MTATQPIPFAASLTDDTFTALVARQSLFVFRVAYAVLRNTHDAEDAAQDTFLKLHRSGAWKKMDDERAFLARSAWRVATDLRPRPRHALPESDPAAPGESPEQLAVRADWSAVVRRLMEALPDQLRQPLALSAVEELTSREIGDILGIPEGTVRSRISRAREILRQKLKALQGGANA